MLKKAVFARYKNRIQKKIHKQVIYINLNTKFNKNIPYLM
jgi:hypothetical protein